MFRENQRVAVVSKSDSLSSPFFGLVFTSGIRTGGDVPVVRNSRLWTPTFYLYPEVRNKSFFVPSSNRSLIPENTNVSLCLFAYFIKCFVSRLEASGERGLSVWFTEAPLVPHMERVFWLIDYFILTKFFSMYYL